MAAGPGLVVVVAAELSNEKREVALNSEGEPYLVVDGTLHSG